MYFAECCVEITYLGRRYRASLDRATDRVDVYREDGDRWIHAGQGRWDGSITDCAADLWLGRASAEHTDDIYGRLEEAIMEELAESGATAR